MFILALLVSAFLSFTYPAYDEANWIEIGYLFTDAISHFYWPGTYVNAMTNHPGISLLWISSGIITLKEFFGGDIFLWHRILLFSIKLVLLLWIIKWVNRKVHPLIGFCVGIFVLLHPFIFIGLRSTWLDQLTAFTMTITILCWINFLETQGRKWQLWTAITLGIALLTKIVSILLLPMLVCITILTSAKKLASLLAILETLLYALMLYFILYPAALLAPLDIPFRRFTMTADLALGGSAAGSVWFYPILWLSFDVILTIGLLFIFTKWRKIKDTRATLAGVASVVYLLLLLLPGLVLQDEDPTAFFEDRYLTPILPLMSIYVFTELWDIKHFYAYTLLAASVLLSIVKLFQLPYVQTIRLVLLP